VDCAGSSFEPAREEAKSVPVLLFVSTSVGDDEARCPAVYASLAALTTCDVARGQTAIADLITVNFFG